MVTSVCERFMLDGLIFDFDRDEGIVSWMHVLDLNEYKENERCNGNLYAVTEDGLEHVAAWYMPERIWDDEAKRRFYIREEIYSREDNKRCVEVFEEDYGPWGCL